MSAFVKPNHSSVAAAHHDVEFRRIPTFLFVQIPAAGMLIRSSRFSWFFSS